MLVVRIGGEGNGVGLILFHINSYLLYLANTVVLNEGIFFCIFGKGPKGPFDLGILSVFSNKLGK